MDNPAGQRSPWSCDSSSSGCGRPTLRGAHPGSSRNSKCWASMSQNPPSSGTNPGTTNRPPPSWRTFLEQHAHELASIDFFVVPTATLKVLFVLVVLVHDRRQIVHFNVTEHPTAQWTAQQLTEAFPFDTAPRYLLRDGDGSYGRQVQRRIRSFGTKEVITAPASPWQNPYVERVIGSILRELLDHVVVLNEQHLKRLLSAYLDYYHPWRTHRSLAGDAPDHRPLRSAKPAHVIDFPAVHGLHHYYLPKVA